MRDRASHLLRQASDCVVEAGDRALKRWGAVAAETKADSTLVTDVDRDVEAFLHERLRDACPGAGFVGEEAGRRLPASSNVTWVCDPIDGTTNFVAGLPHWCVSLALLEGNEAVLGVVYAPVLGLLYQSLAGEGATRNGAPIRVADSSTLQHEDLLCLSTNALKTLRTSGLLCRLRCLGSIALEMCLVADGRAIGAVGIGEGIVDIAASACICAGAGAPTRYLDGAPLDLGVLLSDWRTARHFVTASDVAMAQFGTLLVNTAR